MVLKYIGQFTNDVKKLIANNLTDRGWSFQDYLAHLTKSSFDGSEMTLLIISQMFSVPIAMYHPDFIWMSPEDKQIDECPIVLMVDCLGIWHPTIPNGGVKLKLNKKINFSQFVPEAPCRKFMFGRQKKSNTAHDFAPVEIDIPAMQVDAKDDISNCSLPKTNKCLNACSSILGDSTPGSIQGPFDVSSPVRDTELPSSPDVSPIGTPASSAIANYLIKSYSKFQMNGEMAETEDRTIKQETYDVSEEEVGPTVKSPVKTKAELKERLYDKKARLRNSKEESNTSAVESKNKGSQKKDRNKSVPQPTMNNNSKKIPDKGARKNEHSNKSDTNAGKGNHAKTSTTTKKEYDLRNRDASTSDDQNSQSGKGQKRKRTDLADWVDPQVYNTKRIKHEVKVKAEPVDVTDESVIFCSKCNNVFASVQNLKAHEKNCFSGRRYECFNKGCEKTFSQRSMMHQHYKGVHEKNPFKCPHCNSPYIYKNVMDYHIKKDHTPADQQTWKYVCQKCKFGTDNKSEFQIHTDRHNDVRRYICGGCGFKTFSQSQLTLHMNACIEGIKYKCEECGKEYDQKPKLKKHFKTEHVEGKKVHFCDKCIRQYKYKKSYTKHMKSEHGVDV